MDSNDAAQPQPQPKPPATGEDAWKNKPTNCWPTPANMTGARQLNEPLSPTAGDGEAADDDETLGESVWQDEGGTDAEGDPEAPHQPVPDEREALAENEQMPEQFRQTVSPLDDLPKRPVTEHAPKYDAVHRDLRQSLDDVERDG